MTDTSEPAAHPSAHPSGGAVTSPGPGGASGPRSGELPRRVGIALVVLGVVVAAMLGSSSFGGLFSVPTGAHQVPAIAGGQVQLTRPGAYSVYYQGGSGDSPEPVAQVVGPGHTVVTVRSSPPAGQTRAGAPQLIGTFTASRPGGYRVEVGGIAVGTGALLVGREVGPWLPVLLSVLVGLVVVGLGGSLLVISARRVRRSV